METKTIYREYFPGYMGHIPLKNEVIGMTVGATNDYIKSYLNREPEFEQNLVPSAQKDYAFYNKSYFTDNLNKEYKLEEEKVFTNRSKAAKTWINGSKYQIYPQHVPGYQGHIPGIYGSNILGSSYAKSTAVAIKGDYCSKRDLPPEERYKTLNQLNYQKPKMRSDEEDDTFSKSRTKSSNPVQRNSDVIRTNYNKNGTTNATNTIQYQNEMPQTFKDILKLDKQAVTKLPYIVGYKGFRRGVKSGNYYGKNFQEVSVTSVNNIQSK